MSSQWAARVAKALARSITTTIPRVVRAVTPSRPGRPAPECPATANAISRTSRSTLLEDFTPAAFTLFVRPTKQTDFTAIRIRAKSIFWVWAAHRHPRRPSRESWPWSTRKPPRARATPTTFSTSSLRNQERAVLLRVRQPALAFFTTSPPAPMPCDDTGSAPVNCGTAGPLGIGILTGYNSTAGYDLTTGLGSVNAANLVNKWSTITSALKPSATTLSLNPTSSIAHGTAVTVQIGVTPTPPGTGTP